ncbi:uncharacterized protein BYT42DRAFT_559893 [Radiomyces spectabilis]|uniref:uncharacterized protein n=1 Tax=Radiomyces spectabilis TaxID=64574 RepID=UPI00221E8883|nr:uncharacterized protein BYT42DRAFT_559893 [Radiomyces spectabilis]KAI8388376.1 hypothetical protein BYT42DRAFT_559893 [Radiomyces spectabilis]
MGKSRKSGQKKSGRPNQPPQRNGSSGDTPQSTPFQPLNMFYPQHQYAAIPETASDSDSHHSSHRQSNGQDSRPSYFTTSPRRMDADDILIDMRNKDSSHPNMRETERVEPANMYNSDVDTAGSTHSSVEGDVCFPTPSKKEEGGIDYEALDNYVRCECEQLQAAKDTCDMVNGHRQRRRRLSTMQTFDTRRYSLYGDRMKHPEASDSDHFRFSYYSPAEPSTIHARTISEIPTKDEKLSDMLKRGCFWIDVLNPTDSEMKALSQIFRIHPLTTEDITMEEQREKCEVFYNYYFICFRSFEQDQLSANYLQPLAIYIIVFKEGVLSFHFRPMPHPNNVRKRIKQLKDYINVTPDWICYGVLDDITDSFAPLIRAIEFEVDSIDELVLILKESEQSDMLRRIGYCRKRMMGLLRLLVSKADVVKTLIKRGEVKPVEGTRPALSNEVSLYLGDVQDHIITMLQSLNHYEKISSRSHSNYLAQVSIEMTQTNNEINDVLSKLTALGSVLVPMNLVTGLWGMNVQVPGQYQEDLTWFTCILCSILAFCAASTLVMRHYNIV